MNYSHQPFDFAGFVMEDPYKTLNDIHKMFNNNHSDDQEVIDYTADAKAPGENAVADVTGKVAVASDREQQQSEPELDIIISNVFSTFSVGCRLDLRSITLKGFNVELRRGVAIMRMRRPYTTATLWQTGRVACTGAVSEEQSKIAARRYARHLQKLGCKVKLKNFRIVNVLGTCAMPWPINIFAFAQKYRKDASYEPELYPGVIYKLKNPKATLTIFSTGKVSVTASRVAYVQSAIEHIYPLCFEFQSKRSTE